MSLAPFTALALVNSLAILLGQAYQLARTRLASSASSVLRMTIERDHGVSECELLRRELEVLRAGRESVPPHRRPEYPPEQRLAILQLKRLRGWEIDTTARRFVVHPNTIRLWIKAVEGRGRISLLENAIPWNRIDDAVRWTVHQLRSLCPEPEFGTRSLARTILRAGVQLSRSTVQRVLREPEPPRPPKPRKPPMAQPVGEEPRNLLTPKKPNRVWHMDLIQFQVLWLRFTAAVLLDGFSRKILTVRVYDRTPTSQCVAAVVRTAVKQFGTPRFLITDHGTQFGKRFAAALKKLKVRHVKGRVRAPYLNGKIERLFRTLRIWWRLILPSDKVAGLQRRLENFGHWYNIHRPHSALGIRTPTEAWQRRRLAKPVRFRQRDAVKAVIDIRRVNCRGDPHLPVVEISVRRAA